MILLTLLSLLSLLVVVFMLLLTAKRVTGSMLRPGPLCVEVASSACVSVGSPQVLQLPPTV